MSTLRLTSSLSLTTRKLKSIKSSRSVLANINVSICIQLIPCLADSSDNEEPEDREPKRKFVKKSSFADDQPEENAIDKRKAMISKRAQKKKLKN